MRTHRNALAMLTAVTSVTALTLAGTAPTPAQAQERSRSLPGVVRDPDLWYLNEQVDGGTHEQSYDYGSRDDAIHVMGDWDGDGIATPGVVRPAGDIDADGEVPLDWFLRNSNTPGPADEIVRFGHAQNREEFDTPVVGDWDGDGDDTVGVVEEDHDNNEFVWKLANDHGNATVDVQFTYGEPFAYGMLDPRGYREVPVVGDWDGDGVDGPGVVAQDPEDQPSIWQLRDSLSDGEPDHEFAYGTSDDRPLVGDWDADGDDDPAVHRLGGHWYVKYETTGGIADEHFVYGAEGDFPIVWESPVDGLEQGDQNAEPMTTGWGQDRATVEGSATAREPVTLDALLAQRSGDVDTLEIGFDRSRIGSVAAEYTEGYPREPGSGREVAMRGDAFLEIVLDASQLPETAVQVDEGDDTPVIEDVRVLGQRHRKVHVGVGLSTGGSGAPEVDFRLRSEPDQGVVHLDVQHLR